MLKKIKLFPSFSLMLIGILTMASFTSCKHGPNDPAISLRSRDARLIGDWILTNTSMTITDFDSGNNPTTTTDTEVFDGSTWTSSTDGNVNNTDSYSLEMSITKEGTASVVEIENGRTREENSNWFWMDSKKNKTMAVLSFPNTNWFDRGSYMVDELKNKTLVLTFDYHEKDTRTNGDVTEFTITETWTFEAKE